MSDTAAVGKTHQERRPSDGPGGVGQRVIPDARFGILAPIRLGVAHRRFEDALDDDDGRVPGRAIEDGRLRADCRFSGGPVGDRRYRWLLLRRLRKLPFSGRDRSLATPVAPRRSVMGRG